MILLLTGLVWWHWLLFALLLLVLELTVPTDWFVWVAASAGLTSLVVLIAPSLSWPVQCTVFGILTLATLLVGRPLVGRLRDDTDAPLLNRRSEQYVGRTFTLTEPIENGCGTVRVGDSRWRVSGPALPAGDTVRVVAVDGATFVVEAAGSAAGSD